MKRAISRRKFLACAGLAGLGLAGDAAVIEPFRLKVGYHDYKSRTLAPDRPLKLLHLSDLHASWAVSLGFIDEAVSLGLQSQPDLICITGDFITSKYKTIFGPMLKSSKNCRKAAPTFACLGNHDGGFWAGKRGGYDSPAPVRDFLRASRIELLENRRAEIRLKGRDVRVTGIADMWSEALRLGTAFPPNDSNAGAVKLSFPTIQIQRSS